MIEVNSMNNMKVEDTEIYAVLKDVFKGTPEWPEIYANLKQVFSDKLVSFEDSDRLDSCFAWSDSKQQHRYWSNLNHMIFEYKQTKLKDLMKTEVTQGTNLISMDKQYTRSGKKVRVLCVDRKHDYPVLILDEDGCLGAYTSTGQNCFSYEDEDKDLKEYNPWQDVAVDTKVFVRTDDEFDEELKRHFSHTKNGNVYVFPCGFTSFSSNYPAINVHSARLA